MNTKLLRQKILDLAIRGKLVPQNSGERSASELITKIQAERAELIKQRKLKKDKNQSYIFKADDGSYYEKIGNNEPVKLDDLPFEIPEGWVWCRLGNICDIRNGATPKRDNKSFWENGTVPWFTIEDKHNQGIFITKTKQHITEIALSKDRIVPENSVLLCCTASVGDVAFTKIPVTTNQQFNGITVKDEFKKILSPYYLLIYSLTLKQQLKAELATATTFGFVSVSKISLLLIPLSPLAEQKRIVAKVEELFALIDSLKENKADLQSLTKLARQKILDLAIRGKLVPQDSGDEPASELITKIQAERAELIKQGKLKKDKNQSYIFKADDGSYYEKAGNNEPVKLDDLPFEIPEGWVWCRLKESCLVIMGQSPEGNFINNRALGMEFHQGKICFSDKILNKSDSYTSKITKVATKNSILLCVRAPVGIANITDREICIGRGLCAIQPSCNMLIDFWFYWISCQREDFEKKATGTTFKAISVDNVANQLIPLPPLAEQKRIVAKINELFAQIDTIEESLKAEV